jgi:NTE family protein
MRARATTVSLVLGSGGARGLAHIGVIQWLTEQGYEICSIAGSSIGALVGGIYAARKLEVYAEWVSALERMHVLRLLDPTFGRNGLIKGDRLIGVLRELIGDCAIEDLPLSFTAVAADLESGEEIWLREGRLFDAIRASIATPLVFTPVQHGARTLFDGALVNPLPVAPTLDDATDLTIAVSLNGPPVSRAAPTANHAPVDGSAYRRRLRGLVDRLPLARNPKCAGAGCSMSRCRRCKPCTTPSPA